MTKRNVMWMVCVLLAGTITASGTTVFTDDFSGTLSQWTVDGNATITDGRLVLEPALGDPWHASATSNQKFTTEGKYVLTFETDANGDPVFHERVTMPGGLQIGFSSWGNPAQVSFKGQTLPGTVAGTGITNYGTFRTISMSLDGRNAEIFVNGTSGWSGTLPSNPDFTTYDSIKLFGQFSVITNKYDNVQLSFVPEPATLGLLILGGLLLRRRK